MTELTPEKARSGASVPEAKASRAALSARTSGRAEPARTRPIARSHNGPNVACGEVSRFSRVGTLAGRTALRNEFVRSYKYATAHRHIRLRKSNPDVMRLTSHEEAGQ
ncbi:hypothetical protein [Streptomyces kronopolitis]|uniref:hypothetical protein n=1 Tax=Streptomyces kronopolitis TaxID=1612435 RepID=UPI003D989208